MPQAMKIPEAKAAVDKEWEKLEKIPAWDMTKVRSKKEVIDEARTKDAKTHSQKLWTIFQDYWDAQDKQQMHPGQNGRCTNVIENSKIGMSRHLDSSTTTQMAKIMVQYGSPSRSS